MFFRQVKLKYGFSEKSVFREISNIFWENFVSGFRFSGIIFFSHFGKIFAPGFRQINFFSHFGKIGFPVHFLEILFFQKILLFGNFVSHKISTFRKFCFFRNSLFENFVFPEIHFLGNFFP